MTFSILTDAVGFVRSHPEMFFSGGTPSALPCVEHLVGEILALGAADVTVERRKEWWIVSSSLDWFLPHESDHEQVRKLIPLPEVGPNACRVEIVLVAFARSVATRVSDNGWTFLSGFELSDCCDLEPAHAGARSLAFCFDTLSGGLE